MYSHDHCKTTFWLADISQHTLGHEYHSNNRHGPEDQHAQRHLLVRQIHHHPKHVNFIQFPENPRIRPMYILEIEDCQSVCSDCHRALDPLL